MVAIIGPSGCGKTSLMNILAKRWNESHNQYSLTGSVKANNMELTKNLFRRIGSFVE